jgi:hypothetical protein
LRSSPNAVLVDWELSRDAEGQPQGRTCPAAARWSAVVADADGLLNISRFRARPGNKGLALARTTIRSAADQNKKLLFGYSDDMRIYLNGRIRLE